MDPICWPETAHLHGDHRWRHGRRVFIAQRSTTCPLAWAAASDGSGMDVHFGLFHGLEINIESLRSRVAGRIASATLDDLHSPPARDGTLFLLPDKSERSGSMAAQDADPAGN